jgi:uncharacterized protein YcbX
MTEGVHALSGMYVYPVKGCRGVSVARARVTDRGLEHDRRFMIVDGNGRFVSQRERSELARVVVTLDGGGYLLDVAGKAQLELPRELAAGDPVEASLWGSTVWGYVHGEASRWFSEFLGQECRLLYMPDASRRSVATSTALVSFADGYPFLLISEASLEELNRRSSEPMSMQRFRPNLVVSGGPPHFEDALGRFRIGEVYFRTAKPCDRCVVTTVDPDTGERGREPLRALGSYRRWDGKVWFGTNLVAENQGLLRLGQELSLA